MKKPQATRRAARWSCGGDLAPVRISGVVVTIQRNPKGVPFCRYTFVTKGQKGIPGLDYCNKAVSEGGA